MDLSIIRELPPGRVPVKTETVTSRGRGKALAFAREQIEAGFQVYVVCPHVASNENRALADAESRFQELTNGAFAGLRCALLHGRMDSEEKDALLDAFRRGELDALVSTTVIEVGVDAPRATVMLIEDAGNFGLTQLHQLRGRVGRGGYPAYCFLLGKPATEDAARRLEILCATNDGFEIAEEDFAMRGPGEVHGERQSGLSDLRAARLPRDTDVLFEARRAADRLLARDPELRDPAHSGLADAVERLSRITI
jgi:ATP-dependent DNA helicase RecG